MPVLAQVIPKAEIENHLAGRLKFHAEHREALSHGQPVPDVGSGRPSVSTWNDDIEED